jgi:hypothetical protein
MFYSNFKLKLNEVLVNAANFDISQLNSDEKTALNRDGMARNNPDELIKGFFPGIYIFI